MATESLLSKVNVFPSIDSFNDNLNSVDTNSLNLIKTGAVLIETWVSGTSWYRKYSDGWIEQGFQASIPSYGTVVTMPHKMKDNKYTALGNALQASLFVSCYSETTAGFTVYTGDDASFNAGTAQFFVCGYYQ